MNFELKAKCAKCGAAVELVGYHRNTTREEWHVSCCECEWRGKPTNSYVWAAVWSIRFNEVHGVFTASNVE